MQGGGQDDGDITCGKQRRTREPQGVHPDHSVVTRSSKGQDAVGPQTEGRIRHPKRMGAVRVPEELLSPWWKSGT
jgi:hypothetical protein